MAPKRQVPSDARLPQRKKSKKSKKFKPAAKKNQSATLFTIAPELRNEIYELALVQDKPIEVVKQRLKEPGILKVCRQTREEASAIWYGQNTFRVKVVNIDAGPLITFEKHARKISQKTKVLPQLTWAQRNWTGLLRWCHEAHQHSDVVQANYPELDTLPDTRYTSAIFAMLKTTWGMRDRDWEECKVVLESWRSLLGHFEKAWLVDRSVA